MNDILKRDVTFLRGVGERKAATLKKELEVETWGDLLYYFPYRHVDRTRIYTTNELIDGMPYVQLQGEIIGFVEEGRGAKKRLKAYFKDAAGVIELVWFNGASYILRSLKVNTPYTIFGKPNKFGDTFSIPHPEVEPAKGPLSSVGKLYPMYSATERMKRSGLNSRNISELQKYILMEVHGKLEETLPQYIVEGYQMLSIEEALSMIHFPTSPRMLQRAQARLKMEELFYLTLRMQYLHRERKEETVGLVVTPKADGHLTKFKREGLKFQLTGAQERVVGELLADMASGQQMNRLVQGDVGSGKTVVALLSMLAAMDSGYQVCMMAPTEILAQQHFKSISNMLASQKDIRVALLTGSMKQKERKPLLEALSNGEIDILVGTHILTQEYVQFHNLGLAVIDEQHRFGVYQRSVLWEKSRHLNPHILIMSATPIPRTLAMTLYGDLDVSIIDELPPGRTPIITKHAYTHQMADVNQFIFQQLSEGRQCYIVFPLIEESEKVDLMSLEEGYEQFKHAFPAHKVGMVHGKLKPEVKEEEMRKFASGETNILVATTVIEVGVDVPNATVMIITSAERFGLSQLHQLRGRVGRGSHQSYCILVSGDSIGETSLQRIQIMCQSTDGFYLAEQDLKIRGHGDMEGTRQSGVGLDLRIADLSEDGRYVQFCSNLVGHILKEDPELRLDKNRLLRLRLDKMLVNEKDWGLIS